VRVELAQLGLDAQEFARIDADEGLLDALVEVEVLPEPVGVQDGLADAGRDAVSKPDRDVSRRAK
jgi:hypothetical protein